MPDPWDTELNRMTMVDHAIAYAKRDWPVFPVWWPRQPCVCACSDGADCSTVAKHPITSSGHKAATIHAEQIASWWVRYPHANIGLVTGSPSGFSVLDIDSDPDGFSSLRRLMARNERPEDTIVSQTGGGGIHFFWKFCKGHKCTQNIKTGIDVRSTGGYVLAPPSMHGRGVRYRWHTKGHPRSVALAEPPEWVDKLLRGISSNGSRRIGASLSAPSGPIAEGERNMTLFRWACKWQHDGLGDGEIEDKAFEFNEQFCQPKLGSSEVNKIVGSALRYPKGE